MNETIPNIWTTFEIVLGIATGLCFLIILFFDRYILVQRRSLNGYVRQLKSTGKIDDTDNTDYTVMFDRYSSISFMELIPEDIESNPFYNKHQVLVDLDAKIKRLARIERTIFLIGISTMVVLIVVGNLADKENHRH